MEPSNYETPKANLIQTADTSINFGFKKTRIMNGVAAIFFVGAIAMVFSKYGTTETRMLSIALGTYGFMAATAITSIIALTVNARSGARIVAKILNWFCIVIYLLSILGVAIMDYPQPSKIGYLLGVLTIGALMFVVPQAINLRALSKIKLQLKS